MTESSEYILIIDDDEAQQALIGKYISNMGYRTEPAMTAGEGMKKAKEKKPALILLDLILPDEAGMIVLNKLKDDPETEDIPVIVVTSITEDEIVIAALASGASDIISKPIRNAQLIPRINKAFEIAEYQKKLLGVNQQLQSEKKDLLRYFPDDVVAQILAGDIQPELGGQHLDATIMFMDLRNSTGLAESMNPDNFVSMLNLFFADVFDIIFGIQGSVNKMLGDGVLATFGCPVMNPEYTQNCAFAALKIKEHLNLFNMYLPDYMDRPLGLGIGIASGKVFAGNIGSKRLMEYTVIGDAVNLAARLEGLNKKFDSQILMDGATQQRLGDKYKSTFKANSKVRGKNIEVPIYTLDDFSS